MSELGLRISSRLRDTGSRYWEALFLTFILAYVFLLIYTALGYAEDPRLFPLLVGVPLTGLILLRITMLLSSRFTVSSEGMFRDVGTELEGDSEEDSEAIDDLVRYRRQLETITWLCSLTAFIWAFGFQIGLVIFVFAFVYTYEQNATRAAGATVATYGIVYLLFVRLLSVTLLEPALLPDSFVELLPAVVFGLAMLPGVGI